MEVEDFHRRVLDAVRALPGVQAVGAAQSVPLQGQNNVASVTLTERDAGTEEVPVRVTRLTPGYLEALDLTILAGRGVQTSDGPDAEPVALVNQAFQDRYLGGEPVVGRTFLWTSERPAVRVIGLVEDHIERAVDRPAEPSVYLPLAQEPAWTRTLVVRSSGDAAGLAPALRAAVARVDPTVPVFDVRTLDARMAERMGGFTLLAQLMGGFAALSLVLGAVGIYGVTARSVARRTREIGLRLALGAEPAAVSRSIAGHALRRVGIGLVLGLALAIPMAGVLRGIIVGVDPRSPLSFIPAVLTLMTVGALGSWIPARAASRVDPARTLAGD
jgi:putative ABC transport system permease protein